MAEVRRNNQQGFLGTALTAVPAGTQQSITNLFAQAPGFPSLNVGDYIKLSLDAFSTNFEIIYLIGPYTAGSLNGIITRAAEDSTNWPAGNHLAGTGTWGNDPTVADFTNTTTQPPLTNNTTFGSTAYTDLAVGVETARAEAAELILGAKPSAYTYPYLHAALAAIQSGQAGDFKLGCIGDSTTEGFGSGISGIGGTLSMAKMLTTLGYPAALGMSLPGAPGSGTDVRWGVGTGWTNPAGTYSFGGNNPVYVGNGAAANSLTFTPGNGYAYDSFTVYYLKNSGAGNFYAGIDGGAQVQLIATNGTPSIGQHTFAALPGASHVFNIGQTTGTVTIVGVEPFLSTVPRIRIANLGSYGATIAAYAASAHAGNGSTDAVMAYAANAWIINLGINDQKQAGYSNTTFLTNLANLIAACKNTPSDVIVTSVFPSSPAVSNNCLANEALSAASLPAFCSSHGVGFIDLFNIWGGLNAWNELDPLAYYADNFHPSLTGYVDAARLLVNGILEA